MGTLLVIPWFCRFSVGFFFDDLVLVNRTFCFYSFHASAIVCPEVDKLVCYRGNKR